MKLATLADGADKAIGIITEQDFLPVSAILPDGPRDMVELISRWDDVSVLLAKGVEEASANAWTKFDHRALLAPITRPGKILAIGLNYVDHVTETGFKAPEHQVWFSKQVTSVNGPYADVQLPFFTQDIDYEVELVAVIGRGGRHITENEAPRHVFGYCVGNDVSARDWQMRTVQWMLGKSFDTHSPFGPWITTADEVGDPHVLGITCSVNGEERQRANTSQLCFNIWQQIAHVSQVMTLEPGDIIFSGTPAGVGLGMTPPRYLNPGDVVRCEVEQLGHIEARFVPERVAM
jgi:2-keto-4-pentenoate hydratase/2-oxohepta-3-ene-1,7-dioic acid hydratase in catechol pathway